MLAYLLSRLATGPRTEAPRKGEPQAELPKNYNPAEKTHHSLLILLEKLNTDISAKALKIHELVGAFFLGQRWHSSSCPEVLSYMVFLGALQEV